MDPVSSAIGGLGSLLGSFGLGNNAGEWNQNALVSLWNRAQQGDEMARQMFAQFAGPARQGAVNVNSALERPTIDQAPYTFGANQDTASGIPSLMQQMMSGAYSPEMQRLNSGAEGGANRAGQVGDMAQQLFNGGGSNPVSDQLYAMLAPMMAGQANNSQLALGDVGSNLLGQRGQTAYTQAIQDRATDASNTGGRNGDLNFAMDRAKETLANGGYTPQGDAQNAAGMGLFGQASQKALSNNLLSPGEAANWGREEATNDLLGQTEAMYRQAQARGGGPGTLTANGLENQQRADFADQAARLQSNAARTAFMGQEDKMLQDKGIAGSLAGVGSNLAQGAAQNATARQGQAFSAIPGTQGAATQAMSALLGAGTNAGELEVARMNAGTGMSGTLLNSQNQAAGQFNQASGNQQQYALGGGQLANSASANQSDSFTKMLQSILGAGQLGNQSAQTQMSGQNAANANTNDFWKALAGANQDSINTLAQQGGQALNYAGQNVALMGAPFAHLQGPTSQQGFDWGGIGSALGGLNNMGNK